jgi:hypothetical protein
MGLKKIAVAKVCGLWSGSEFKVNTVAKAKVSHILGPGSEKDVESLHVKGHNSVLRLRYSKE